MSNIEKHYFYRLIWKKIHSPHITSYLRSKSTKHSTGGSVDVKTRARHSIRPLACLLARCGENNPLLSSPLLCILSCMVGQGWILSGVLDWRKGRNYIRGGRAKFSRDRRVGWHSWEFDCLINGMYWFGYWCYDVLFGGFDFMGEWEHLTLDWLARGIYSK